MGLSFKHHCRCKKCWAGFIYVYQTLFLILSHKFFFGNADFDYNRCQIMIANKKRIFDDRCYALIVKVGLGNVCRILWQGAVQNPFFPVLFILHKIFPIFPNFHPIFSRFPPSKYWERAWLGPWAWLGIHPEEIRLRKLDWFIKVKAKQTWRKNRKYALFLVGKSSPERYVAMEISIYKKSVVSCKKARNVFLLTFWTLYPIGFDGHIYLKIRTKKSQL